MAKHFTLTILIIFCFSLQAQDRQAPLLQWPEIDEASFTESPLYKNLLAMPLDDRKSTCTLFLTELQKSTSKYQAIRNYVIIAILALDNYDHISYCENPLQKILWNNDIPVLTLCSKKTTLLQHKKCILASHNCDIEDCKSIDAARICLNNKFSPYSLSANNNGLYMRDNDNLKPDLTLIAYLLHQNRLLATGLGKSSGYKTPLQIAASRGNNSLIKLLLRYGAKVDQIGIPQSDFEAEKQLNPVDYPVYLGDIPEIIAGEQFVNAPVPDALNQSVLDEDSFRRKISSHLSLLYGFQTGKWLF